jgi:hypothetical protein
MSIARILTPARVAAFTLLVLVLAPMIAFAIAKGILSDGWGIAVLLFCIGAPFSAMTIALITRPQLNVMSSGAQQGGPFDGSQQLDEAVVPWFNRNYAALTPVLAIWQRRAWTYGWFHHYVVIWTTITAISLPFLVPYVGRSNNARLFVQMLSAHTAVIYGVHSVYNIEKLYQRYRLHESSVYGLVRRMKDDPASFGDTNDAQRKAYLEEIERIRALARSDEIDSTPTPSAPERRAQG